MSLASVEASLVSGNVDMFAGNTGRLGLGGGLLGGGVGVGLNASCRWTLGLCCIGKPKASSSILGRCFEAAPPIVRLHPVGTKGGSIRPELGPAKACGPQWKSR